MTDTVVEQIASTAAPVTVDQAARDAAANARQMVLTRDATIAGLTNDQQTLAAAVTAVQTLAANYQAALAASVADRAALHAAIAALEARTLTGQVKRVVTGVTVALNATGTLTVVWDAPIVGSYVPLLVSPVNVSAVTYTNVTAAGLSVSYKAGVLVGVGVVFNVVALRVG